jgi:hypothetical protein
MTACMTLKKGKEFLKSLANFLEQILLGAGLGLALCAVCNAHSSPNCESFRPGEQIEISPFTMPRMTRASVRANKSMASNDPPSVHREGSWQFPTVSALKYSGAIIDELLLSNKNSIPSRAKNTNQRSNSQTLRWDRKRTHLWLAMVSMLPLGKIVFVVTNILSQINLWGMHLAP